MPYVVPSVLVYQEFNLVPDEITDPLRAHISGPHAFLVRYDEADEKALGSLGDYDPESDTPYAWPNKPAGSRIDLDYTKVFIEDAKLVLFEDLLLQDQTVAPVDGYTNRVRIGGSKGFKVHGAYDRLDDLFDRDVQLGDRVHLRGSVGSEVVELDSYVLGIAGDVVAATVGAAYWSDDNPEDQNAVYTASIVSPTPSTPTFAASGTSYNGLVDGYINDTYTITVLSGSSGGDHTTALIKVTTASGGDNVASMAPGDNGTFFDIGERGLQIKFTGTEELVAGSVYRVVAQQAFEQVQAVSSGTYSGSRDTTYVIEVTSGGLFGDADPDKRPQVTVRTVHGNDASSGPVTVTDDNVEVAVGTKGVYISFYGTGGESSSVDDSLVLDEVAGLRKGDLFYIDVTAEAEGRMGTLILGHNLPTNMLEATDLDLQIYLLKDLEVSQNREGYDPLLNWEGSLSELTINGGMVAYDDSWTDDGELLPILVEAGSLYVQYRAWQSTLASDVGSISDPAELDTLISGELHPDNPLKWGVSKALANSNGTAVKFTSVANPDDLDSWGEVLERVLGREDVYNLVPLTTDRDVQDLYAAHVTAQSSAEKGRWRACFFALESESEVALINATLSEDEEEVLATLTDDPDTSGNQYTLLTITSGNAGFVEAGAQPGDIVRALFSSSFGEETYSEFVIDEVVNEETVKLVSGHSTPINTAEKIEIWHPRTKNEIATAVGAAAASFGDSRVCAVWPDVIGSGGQTYPGYHLCAALAGLRSGIVPHQGMTNLEVNGFDDVSRSTTFFSASQLDIMAEAGVWIVTADANGTVHTRHALTTDTTDTNTKEEMIRANVDSISYLFRRRLAPYVGISNVTPGTISVIHLELTNTITYLKSNGFVDRLGAQLIDGTVADLRAHTLLRDRLVAVLDLNVPVALNNIEVHLVV